jgi:hypothetical protein
MMVEPDARGFENAGNRHIIDVAHGIQILEPRVDAGHEAIGFGVQTPGFGFGHVLFSFGIFCHIAIAIMANDAIGRRKMTKLRPFGHMSNNAFRLVSMDSIVRQT